MWTSDMFYLKHQQVDDSNQIHCMPLLIRTQYEDKPLLLCLLSPQCSTLEHTQSQNDCPVPSRHKQSCTFRSFSVQRGTHRLCDKGHMRNVTQTSAPLLDLPDLSVICTDLCRRFNNMESKYWTDTNLDIGWLASRHRGWKTPLVDKIGGTQTVTSCITLVYQHQSDKS